MNEYSLYKLLSSAPIDRLEAEIMLGEVLQKPRSYLHAHPEDILTPEQYDQYHSFVQRRLQGEPITYLTGKREFFSLRLKVTADTLIPRHETELLVETVLTQLPETPQTILELGTGSGAIAIALAHTRPQWKIMATDNSLSALKIAKENAAHHQLKNIQFIHSDWFENIPAQQCHAIVSNPPYIAENDKHLSQGDLRFEPKMALVAKENGLADLKKIIQCAPNYLVSGGGLFVEHGYDQAFEVQQLMQVRGFQSIKTEKDLAGLERMTMGVFRYKTQLL